MEYPAWFHWFIFGKRWACFKRRASHVPNELETIDNEAFQLINYLLFLMRSAHKKRNV